jgi:hypothetical protein
MNATTDLDVREIKLLIADGVEDPCVYCGRPTAFNSEFKLFVNRVGADRQDDTGYVDGWACPECAGYECQECGEYIYVDTEIHVEEPYGNYHEHCYNENKHGKVEYQ